jgi:sortase (surface protein transpeptidase)
MYSIDERDQVIADLEAPQCEGGAPLPLVIASDARLSLAYYMWSQEQLNGQNTVAILYFHDICHYFRKLSLGIGPD